MTLGFIRVWATDFYFIFRGEISQSFGLKFSNNKYSFVNFFVFKEEKINNFFGEMNFQRK
jgi:hypothetical protein